MKTTIVKKIKRAWGTNTLRFVTRDDGAEYTIWCDASGPYWTAFVGHHHKPTHGDRLGIDQRTLREAMAIIAKHDPTEYVTLPGFKVPQRAKQQLLEAVDAAGLCWLVSEFSDGSTTWTVLVERADDAELEAVRETLWAQGVSSVEIVHEEIEA